MSIKRNKGLQREHIETYNTVGPLRPMKYSCKAKITYLYLSKVAIDKDVITFEVPVNYRRIMAVQISEPTEDLSGPILDSPDVYSRVLLPVTDL